MPKKQAEGRQKLKDIAAQVGVSVATVSAVLSPNPSGTVRVGEKTRRRILAAARESDYVPNIAAQRLARGRSDMIAVFTYEGHMPFDPDQGSFGFLLGIERAIENRGKDILIVGNPDLSGRRRSGSSVHRVTISDGAVLIGVRPDAGDIKSLIAAGFPFVTVGRRVIPGAELSSVVVDYDALIGQMVEELAKYGHRSVFYLMHSDDQSEPFEQRRESLVKHTAATLDVAEVAVETADVEALLTTAKASGVTSLICERMEIAERIQEVADRLRIRFPEDLSLLVFEDNWHPDRVVPWMCWSDEREQQGFLAAELLIDIIEGRVSPPHTITITPELVRGKTVGPARGQ